MIHHHDDVSNTTTTRYYPAETNPNTTDSEVGGVTARPRLLDSPAPSSTVPVATTMTSSSSSSSFDNNEDSGYASEHDELLMESGRVSSTAAGAAAAEVRTSRTNDVHHGRRGQWWTTTPVVFAGMLVTTLVFTLEKTGFHMIRRSPEENSIFTVEMEGARMSVDHTQFSFPPVVHHAESSPFFDTVLPWNQTADDDGVFHGAIEFCSDTNGNYAYGLPGRCVPGTPAPLIRMFPKHHYHLTLINTADLVTNLHTHGLHVSGVGSVDDVTRNVEPGECLLYKYYILEDADVGTFWYHPHRHPLVSRCAYGGAYGMLLVDELPQILQTHYPTHVQNFLSNPNNEIPLQFSSMLSPNKVRYNRVNGLEAATPSTRPNNNKTTTATNTTKAEPPLTLLLQPDVYYHMRISAVVYSDSVNYVEFFPPDACHDIRPIAYDGVYRSEIPHPQSSSKHMMTVSSRLDLAIQCQHDVQVHFHQGANISADDDDVETHMVAVKVMTDNTASSSQPPSSASLVVDLTRPQLPSSPFWDAKLQTSWKPRRPYYMPDLMDEEQVGQFWVDDAWNVSMDDYFTNGTKAVSVNQVVWDPERAIRTFDLNELVEWRLLRTQTHPYHAHINRMQIVQKGGCGHGRFEEGEYFDTITADQNECLVRVKFFDFAGRIVIHCHRFGHEDKGMMTWIDILGGHGHGVQAEPEVNCTALPY